MLNSFSFQFQPKKFPHKGHNYLFVLKRLNLLIKELAKFKKRNISQVASGHLMTYPTKWASLVWRLLVSYNPGNLGNWSLLNKKTNHATGVFEAEVVAQMLDLYQAKTNDWGGYFTSGATEANIFSAWLGRKKLASELKKEDKICLLRTDLTHYSVTKAADVVGVDDYTVAVSKDWLGMDVIDLRRQLKQLYGRGYRGFLLPLTYGFTLMGTDDDARTIYHEVDDFKVTHPQAKFFIWIDAALAGLIQPFTKENWAPLEEPVQMFAVDFHKFGQVPQPAGLVLYRQELLSLIEKPIDYLSQNDNTLLGSRTGISPVAVWANLQSGGGRVFQRKIKTNLVEKKKFIDKYSRYPELELVTSPHNLNLGLIIKKRKKYWSDYFGQKYDILFKLVQIKFADKKEKLLMGKVFFLN